MDKVKSLEELKEMRERLRNDIALREKSNDVDTMVQIRVSMATCGIAAGAKEIMAYLISTLNSEQIDAVVTQTGCMGHCYAEPTIEVHLPGRDPIVYGRVNQERAGEIIEKYIKKGELVADIIPVNYNLQATE